MAEIIRKTTIFTRNYCCICREKNVRIHRIKKESIVMAYIKFKIVIQRGTCCCERHLNNNGLIRDDQFELMPTFEKAHPVAKILKLEENIATHNKERIFDKFNKIKTLSEDLCFQITGWTKEQFIEFGNQIKITSNNKKRSKWQLIAIYRFWLRKGITQDTLALFKNKTSQQQICQYLNSIRIAINKDFVPLYLGPNHKPREFFLNHNTKTALIVHDLKEDELVVVADATYCQIEKSTNNKVQFSSYSGQKKYNLFKPFILCCADGYIIDCYGPFAATLNDATIFKHIIETDIQLRNLLIQEKTTLFLDRGIKNMLINYKPH